MAATNINRVVLTGNLTRDPELRSLPSGMSVCSLRIAVQHAPQGPVRRVGRQAELLRRHRLGRAGRELRALPLQGRPVALDGRLEWREWEDQDGNKRQAVEIIADSVQFLGGRDDGAAASGGGGFTPQLRRPGRRPRLPARGARAAAAATRPADDDIPF